MKKLFLSLVILSCSALLHAQIYMAKECVISFFSPSPMEDIKAENKVAKPIMNTSTGDIQVRISIIAFTFPDHLMEEHFNENYMESDKFPNSEFKGKINEKVDYSKDGTTKVTVSGKLKIHGVELDRTLEGTVTVKGNQIILDTKFMVHLADYKIVIPKLVAKNIAEDIEVKLNATLEPFKK